MTKIDELMALAYTYRVLSNGTHAQVEDARAALKQALEAALKPGELVDFDTAFDTVNWDEWRHRPVRELVRELHRVTTPPAQTPVEPEQSEPACYQYQDRDGQWCNFINDKHYEDTKLDGNWPIRALYAAPPRREPLTYSEQLKHWQNFTATDVEWDEYRALYKHFAEIHGITGEKT
jgi:hypothetical protein